MSKVGVEDIHTFEDNSVNTLKSEEEASCTKKKVPKRVLHFSDGTIEEFSSDEESNASTPGTILPANIAELSWFPWFWYQTVFVSSKALSVCDYLGESLANFFGIVSPKYEYEIEQYKKSIAEEEERRKEDAELGSLSNENNSVNQIPVVAEPHSG